MPYGRFFEEFTVGEVIKHWPGRTISETDNTWFSLLTMNQSPGAASTAGMITSWLITPLAAAAGPSELSRADPGGAARGAYLPGRGGPGAAAGGAVCGAGAGASDKFAGGASALRLVGTGGVFRRGIRARGGGRARPINHFHITTYNAAKCLQGPGSVVDSSSNCGALKTSAEPQPATPKRAGDAKRFSPPPSLLLNPVVVHGAAACFHSSARSARPYLSSRR